jgi:hypothetical protein
MWGNRLTGSRIAPRRHFVGQASPASADFEADPDQTQGFRKVFGAE